MVFLPPQAWPASGPRRDRTPARTPKSTRRRRSRR